MFVAGTALFENERTEGSQINTTDSMGGMAIDTDRQLFLGIVDQLAVDGSLELFGDTEVTFGTGLDDIVSVDA